MAKKIIKAQMKQRLDTKANWASQNPVLLAGELGIVSDDPNLYKVGDGTTAWNALPFRGFDGTLVHTTGDSETAVMSQKAVTIKLSGAELTAKSIQRATEQIPVNAELIKYGYYRSTGGYNPGTSARNTDLVSIGGYSYLECTTQISSEGCAVAFFDKDQNFLQDLAILGNNSITSYKVNLRDPQYSAAKYLCVCYFDASQTFMGYKCRLSGETDLPTEVEILKTDVALLLDRSVLVPLNAELIKYGYYRSTGGYNPGTGARNTDLVSIGGYSYLECTTQISSEGCAVAFFDKDQNFLQDLAILGNNSITSYKVNLRDPQYSAAKYLCVCYYDTSGQFANYECRLTSDADQKAGPNILVFGDSITDCCNITESNGVTTNYAFRGPTTYYDKNGNAVSYYFWPYFVNKILNCKELRNYAKSGATYHDREHEEPRQNCSHQINLALADLNNPGGAFNQDTFMPDIVIFALGTNDGNPDDTPESAYEKIIYTSEGYTDVEATLNNLNRGKLCEAVIWAYLTIKKRFPFALCMSVLPIQRVANNNSIGKLHDYLKQLCNRFGFIVIDGAFESGIIRDTNTYDVDGATLKDGLHPNDAGQNMMARMIISSIKSHYISHEDLNPII